jgi:hypothetical protein
MSEIIFWIILVTTMGEGDLNPGSPHKGEQERPLSYNALGMSGLFFISMHGKIAYWRVPLNMISDYSYWKSLFPGNCRKPKSGGSFSQKPNRLKLSIKKICIRKLSNLVQTARGPQYVSYRRSITNLSICSSRNKYIQHMWEGKASDSFRMTLKAALNLQQERNDQNPISSL